MKKDKPKKPNHLVEGTGHLVPRHQPPRNLGTAKIPLAQASLLGKDPRYVVVFCIRCRIPLFSLRPQLQKHRSTKKVRPNAKSLGPWSLEDVKRPDQPCPNCKAFWGEYKNGKARYWTSQGWA